MTKPTKPAAVDGPTLDDAADAQLFSSKTFAWVEYTPLAVQYMADSNDYVDLVAAAVDADAMATEAGRAQAVLKAGEAADSADEAAASETQAGLYAAAAGASSPVDLTSSDFGDLLQVVDVGAGVKGLAMSSQRLERSASFLGGTPSLNLAAAQFHYGTLTANTVFTFDVSGFGALTGEVIFFVLEITQDATLRTITFPASVEWKGGAAPDVPAVGEKAVYTFASRDLGVTWLGTFNGAEFA
ncbi:hypothetical protein [Sulfitobacter pacificus]|uniref:Uncharacterized protein n=1 Tax=Sulfitobacter pacificus TaxID=1499314 RepID=A0ABQ5VGD6_9RHOB|nr:hypothetical protein [Sulfitobacter pacificus]GLQ26139.1 hypothetical protein GCM10007927_09420 [Sulfitobacter pacificus]